MLCVARKPTWCQGLSLRRLMVFVISPGTPQTRSLLFPGLHELETVSSHSHHVVMGRVHGTDASP